MKAKYLFRIMTGTVILAMLATGCKKDDPAPAFEEFSFDAEEVLAKLPDGLKNSTDEYAQQCVGFIESAVDMSSFFDNMTPPDDARQTDKKGSSGTWSWTWSYMGESYTFYWTYDEDNTKRYWTMEIQFGDGPRYDYIEAWEMKDGSQGWLSFNFNWVYIYDDSEDYEDLYWTYTWRTDGDGTYYFDWYYDSSESGYQYLMHYDIVINPDGSGSIDYYSADVLFYHMEWDAAGNGSWAYYLGDYTMTGAWTAG